MTRSSTDAEDGRRFTRPPRSDAYWSHVVDVYDAYPTIRHRRRLVVAELERLCQGRDLTTLRLHDFGCGNGQLLAACVDACRLREAAVSGSDVSAIAIDVAGKRMPAAQFTVSDFPAVDHRLDVVVCSEVLEHTTGYRRILEWTHTNLAADGAAIFTTQGGRIHASDRYAGHTQHFDSSLLCAEMRDVGFTVERVYHWGWPLFSLQKWLTNWRFEQVRDHYLEGGMNPRKRMVFAAAYLAYFVHDAIRLGPQIVVTVRRRRGLDG